MNRREELKNKERKGIKKTPGISTVEVNGKIYESISDDKSNPNVSEIHNESQILTEEMIKAGYNADTSRITRDVESKEEKKELLCRRIEKLSMICIF